MTLTVLYCLIICSCNADDSNRIAIGIFGGSQSAAYNLLPVREKWQSIFNASVTQYGIPGAGFSSRTENSVPLQIEKAPVCDVYILWASTNDATNCSIENDDENDIASQSGGIKRSVELIKAKNSNAVIVFFTSIPVVHKSIMEKLPIFVAKQIEFCRRYNISYLNQFDNCLLTREYFSSDEIHILDKKGYLLLESKQTNFLKQRIKIKK